MPLVEAIPGVIFEIPLDEDEPASCGTLRATVQDALPGYVLHAEKNGALRMRTHAVMPDGEDVIVWLTQRANELRVSDGGYTREWLAERRLHADYAVLRAAHVTDGHALAMRVTINTLRRDVERFASTCAHYAHTGRRES